MAAKAKTFLGTEDNLVEVDVLTGPSSTGLVKLAYGSKIFVRHVDRIEPLNDSARALIRPRVASFKGEAPGS